MLREEIRRGLERKLTSEQGQRVWVILQRREPMLTEFPVVFDLVNALKNPKAPSKFTHQIILRLIGLYRQCKGRGKRASQPARGGSEATLQGRHRRQVILAILLLVLWEDIEAFTEAEHYKLWRIDDEPFTQAQFAYILLMAEGDFKERLVKGETIRAILADEAKEFIKEEFKRQCVYEI